MNQLDDIRELEGAAYRAWVAKETAHLNGWVLRFNDGVTRRANSVFPLGPPPIGRLEDVVETITVVYRKRGITPRFQMTRIAEPENLDSVLELKGYSVELSVSIQTHSLEKLTEHEKTFEIIQDPVPTDDWLKAYAEGSGHGDTLEARRSLMTRTKNPSSFAAALIDDKIVSVSQGVVDGDWLGFFNVVTIEEYRRQGAAFATTVALAEWAQKLGSTKAYLQVMTSNEPAMALYRNLGFQERYQYWYRQLLSDR